MKNPDGNLLIRIFLIVAVIVSAVMFFSIGHIIPRNHFGSLLLAFSLAFICYFIFVAWHKKMNLRWILVVALLFRLAFLFSTPQLSDDYFRFIWDGRLLENGLSPYISQPSEIETSTAAIIDPHKELIRGMNSEAYYSVYPPLNQFFFWIAAVASTDTAGAVNVLRSILILADMLFVFLIFYYSKESQGVKPAVLYGLNPLVIAEISGNLHFEGIVGLLLFLGVTFLLSKKNFRGGLFFGLSAAIKLTPFIYLPALFFFQRAEKRIGYASLSLLVFSLSGWWLLEPVEIWNFFQSLRLYFQTFEFNASLYYLARGVGRWWLGYNPIAFTGIVLPLTGALLIIWISFRKSEAEREKIWQGLVLAGTIYLLFATTVHPWYLIPVLALAANSGFYYPFIWSGIVLLSYSAYQSTEYTENMLLIGMGYSLLYLLIMVELFRPSWLQKLFR